MRFMPLPGGKVVNDFGIVEQIRRASLSVMANLSLGSWMWLEKIFVKLSYIASGSAGEILDMFSRGIDLGSFIFTPRSLPIKPAVDS